ncbi:hypothetical protein OHR68_09745 [Spirillospora sp. NBC_00431]
MSAATEAPDTPRRHLLAIAHRAITFPDLARSEVEDEVALISVIVDREARERAFRELMGALRRGERDAAETLVDLLLGRLR